MMNVIALKPRTPMWRRLAVLSVAAGATLLAAASVFAGECPADQRVADGAGQPPGPTMPKDVTDVVRHSTDLAKEPLALQGRLFRLRQLEMKPGGIVPWHSHADRPALIVTIKGEIMEYASTCAAPIVHTAGDATAEKPATSHWWKNLSGKPVELLSFDILHDPTDTNM